MKIPTTRICSFITVTPCLVKVISSRSFTGIGSGTGTGVLSSVPWIGGVSPALRQLVIELAIRQGYLHSQASVPHGAGACAGALRSASSTGDGSGTGALPSTL